MWRSGSIRPGFTAIEANVKDPFLEKKADLFQGNPPKDFNVSFHPIHKYPPGP